MTTPAPNMDQYFFRASAEDFKKIPGSPIAYWVSEQLKEMFGYFRSLESFADIREGLNTGDNDLFLRLWPEVSSKNFLRFGKKEEGSDKWFPIRKGGEFRKWYGNNDYVVEWQDDGKKLRAFSGSTIRNPAYYLLPALSWSRVSSSKIALRYYDEGMIFDSTAPSMFPQKDEFWSVLGLVNSKVIFELLAAMSPTLDFRLTSMKNLPFMGRNRLHVPSNTTLPAEELAKLSRNDWDSYETSWDFTELPLLKAEHRGDTLAETYANLRAYWREQTLEMQRLEEENNRIFIEAYGLEDELTPDVPLSEITLTCNPSYRYSRVKNQTEEKLEAMLLADTMREFVSYAVGCMFGRYSLDKPGLILANQGEGIADYHAQVPEPRFAPEEHGVIPILDENWFTNDIVERFHAFLRTTFGEQHFEENLLFVEQGLNRTVRDYFLRTFYNDHERTYKKRPIYWMFSSPKGSFNALIYLHRYRPDTVSVVLNEYLREYAAKLRIQKAELEALSIREDLPAKDRADAEKGIDKLRTILSELEDYERDVLHPLAGEQLEIDLDDGVKANYPKFKTALKKIF